GNPQGQKPDDGTQPGQSPGATPGVKPVDSRGQTPGDTHNLQKPDDAQGQPAGRTARGQKPGDPHSQTPEPTEDLNPSAAQVRAMRLRASRLAKSSAASPVMSRARRPSRAEA